MPINGRCCQNLVRVLPSLENLELASTPFSDRDAEVLAGVKLLTGLSLDSTDIGDEGAGTNSNS